jgi:hypothetical protein
MAARTRLRTDGSSATIRPLNGLIGSQILEACNVRDAELGALGRRLADRMLSPIPGSQPCAEALGTLLALHLLWNDSTLPRRDGER